MDYTKLTLGELLSHKNETVKRNAVSILKQLQKLKCKHDWDSYGKCCECGVWKHQVEEE